MLTDRSMVSGGDVVIDGWVVRSMPHGTLQSMPVLVLATQSQYHFSEVMLKGDLSVPDTPTLLQTRNSEA